MNRYLANSTLPDDYPALLDDLKRRIRESQLRASVSVNHELVLLYWRIGREILTRQSQEAWPEEAIGQQLAARLPWFHNCVLLDKLDRPAERVWYAKASIEYGWSRKVLVRRRIICESFSAIYE